jgi:parallel beta-helix repeat protein
VHRLRLSLVMVMVLATVMFVQAPTPLAGASTTQSGVGGIEGSGATVAFTSGLRSNMCMSVLGASTTPKTALVGYDCEFHPNQQFTWMSDGSIRVYSPPLCLEAAGTTDGSAVVTDTCNGAANQKWQPANSSEIQGINGKIITVLNAVPANGQNLIIWSANSGANEQWNTTILTPGTTTQGIALSPGQSIQAAVNANPAGTTFTITPGTYYSQSVIPKTGDSFLGQPGAVLDGQGTAKYAFWEGPAPYPNNVTISGLKVTNYTPATQTGTIDAGGYSPSLSSTGWIIQNNEVSYNDQYGIRAGNSTQVLNNYVHHNKRLNITGSANNELIANNEIAYGNYGNFYDTNFEAGGTKFSGTNGLVLRGNYVHDNLGVGLHVDLNNVNTLIDSNNVVHNGSEGIVVEVSYTATISNNTVTNNGLYDPRNRYTWLWNAGIGVHDSPNVQVYGNTVSGNWAGIVGIQQNRTADVATNGPHLLQNYYVHDNIITETTVPPPQVLSTAAGIGQDDGDQNVFGSYNNRYVHNTYYLGANPYPFAWQNGPRNQAQWLAYGEDVTGTFNH